MSFVKYLSLVKFSHTIFAMPFAIVGFFLALQQESTGFNWLLFLLVVACMVFARNAAMGFNRYIDRTIDKNNPRTSNREIPTGIISPKNALIFVIINSLLFIGTTWFINQLVFYLSPVALLVTLGYSYTKRFTSLSHLVLGTGLALAPIGAYLAVVGHFDFIPVLLSVIVLFWVSGFDIIYSLQDEKFDQSNNLHSIPQQIGTVNALIVSLLLHLAAFTLLIAYGIIGHFGIFFWIGSSIFSVLLFYQHIIVGKGNLKVINLAFGTLNGIASFIFGIFHILDILI